VKEGKEDDLTRILFTTDHRNAGEAFIADMVDPIPLVGELTSGMRIEESVEKETPLEIALRSGDLIGGILPAGGTLFDLLTPTNMLTYLYKEKIKKE